MREVNIRKLIKDWNMKVVVVDGEERIQARPQSQQELNKYGEWVKSHKELLIAEIKAIENEKAEREAKIQAIEGLKELKAAIAQEQYEYEQRQKRWESESLSSIIPQKPIVSVAELKKRFPRAAAYVKAENWTLSNNSGKRQAGKKALERIINGEYHEQVLADMEAEWNAYTKQHIWD
jgi:hypothetical protein